MHFSIYLSYLFCLKYILGYIIYSDLFYIIVLFIVFSFILHLFSCLILYSLYYFNSIFYSFI